MKVSWLAVQNGDKARILGELGLREVGTVDEETEAHLVCGFSATGWLVVVDSFMSFDLERLLSTASAGGLAVGCYFTEVVMFSQSQAWRDGQLVWKVSHDPEKELKDLTIEGAPPAVLKGIVAQLSAKQDADVTGQVDHMFDAPVDLATALCGYRNGEPIGAPWSIVVVRSSGASQGESTLPSLMRDELLPQLPSLGWGGPPVRISANGCEYNATRIRNGRLEALRFLWVDDGRDLELTPSIAVLAEAEPGGELLANGRIELPQPQARGGFGEMLRQIGKPKPPHDVRVRELLDHTRNALPLLDGLIDAAMARFADQRDG